MPEQPSLIDIGANLGHDSFDDDRDAVLARARRAGVTTLIVTGSSEASSRAAAELAARHPGRLYATAGVHPHHAGDYGAGTGAALHELARLEAVVAIGECGLDYFRNFSPAQAQRAAFRAQLELAAECGLPVFLHQREAHADFVAALAPYLARIPRAVAHCFTGDRDMLRTYLDLGLYIGITGWICDERRGRGLYDIAGEIPLARLMIETDAPYLLPRTLRPRPPTRRNEPAYLPEILRVLAAARGENADMLAAATTRNAREFFGI